MAIDKIIPIRLDKSSDYKLVPKTSMVDALNMLITEDESDGGDNSTGNLGVLKNLKGNQVIEYVTSSGVGEGNAKIIGSVTDTKLKIVYFFVWHENASEHGVYAYDQFGKLPGGGNTSGRIRRIHKSNLYKFPEHGFVKGDIIYTSKSRLDQSSGGPIKPNTQKDFEKDTILYFTDNTNEPRKLNVYMAMLSLDGTYSPEDKLDFITACPKTPLTPITFEFDSDPDRTISNFKSGPGFQFAYQYISKDGVESAISPYSDIAFSPGIINQGTLTSIDHSLHNRCQLNIPLGGAEIKSIRILARQFNNPELVEIDETPNSTRGLGSTKIYSFYNDRIVKGVSTNEVNKQFDNLPRKAEAQSVVDNRLMYGNYLEGFDNVSTSCSGTVTFEPRGVELIDFDLKVVPAISESDETEGPGAKNKSAGYILDASQLPQELVAGTVISVSLNISPGSNFHVYQANNSYHQSRHKGAFQQGTEYQINYNASAADGNYDGGDYGNGENTTYGHQTIDTSGAQWIQDRILNSGKTVNWKGDPLPWGIPYSGNNHGVGVKNLTLGLSGGPKWNTTLGSNSSAQPKNASYGTSAGNPLIFKGGLLTFSCKIKVLSDIENDGRAALTSAISQALSGDPITWNGGEAFELINSESEILHLIDEDLENGQKISEGSPLSKLISGVIETHDIEDDTEETMTSIYKSPLGHFIVKKADVTFYLEKDSAFSSINSNYEMLRLCIGEVKNVETVTVAKKKFPNSPWFVFTKAFLNGTNPDISSFSYGFGGLTTNDPSPSDPNISGTNLINEELNTLDDWNYSYEQEATTEPYSVNLDFSEFGGDNVSVENDATVLPVQVAGLETVFLSAEAGTLNISGEIDDEGVYPVLKNNLEQLQEQFFLGYLDFTEFEFEGQSSSSFFGYNKFNEPEDTFPFSLLDGEGGPGGNLSHNLVNGSNDVPSLSSAPRRVHVYNRRYFTGGGLNSITEHYDSAEVVRVIGLTGAEFTGTVNSRIIPTRDSFLQHTNYSADTAGGQQGQGVGWEESDPITGESGIRVPNRSFIPLLQGTPKKGLDYPVDDGDVYPYSHYFQQSSDWPFVIDFPQKHTYIEILNKSIILQPPGSSGGEGGDRTFKSNANHDFGIVYYDQRGRHGFVSHLQTVYVPGYSQLERGVPYYGRSVITLNIHHDPPNWAHSYKLAYTKNTSVENFIQYSAGGAFPAEDIGSLIQSSLIYVSLNYLQESSLSYVSDWGARTPEGGLSMFKHIDGGNQKVRVVSAYSENNNREFFHNYEFDIVDVVLLGLTNNPLSSFPEQDPEKTGEFVVLKNNPNAEGFSFSAVADNSHLWNNNCIIELYTPKKDIESESRFYYEIGDTYKVNNPGGITASHSMTNITLDKGDVWWRRVPVNLREYADSDFTELINSNESGTEGVYSSNFKSYYLETETASDLFKANASLIGRPNIILNDAVETIRESSITYSDQSNPNSSKINYSSFNLTLSNFKDLQEEFGDINYMCNMEGDVFVIQSDRCTLVPASKTLFSDVSGTNTVAASKSPLGQEKIFAGRAGCDNNPESVVQVGAFVYFAHKNLGKVYRFNPSNGVSEISDKGMASYFRGLFKAAINKSISIGDFINYDDVRVVGGFDPVNEEYLLTVVDPLTYGAVQSGGGSGGNDDSASSVTVNSLEQQIWNIMDAIVSTQDENDEKVFDIEDLPIVLQDFYNSGGTESLDPNNDGIFDATEIVNSDSIRGGLESGIDDLTLELTQSLTESLANNDLSIIHDAIADSNVEESVNGVIGYINNLELPDADAELFEQHIQNVVLPLRNYVNHLNVRRQSYFSGTTDEILGAFASGSASPEDFMGVVGEGGSFPLTRILENATAVSNALQTIQLAFAGGNGRGLQGTDENPVYANGDVFNGPVLENQESVLLNGDFFPEFKTALTSIMNESVSGEISSLDVAQEFIASSYLGIVGSDAISNIQANQIPTAIVDALNEQFNSNLLVTDIPVALVKVIEDSYLFGGFDFAPDNPNLSAQVIETSRPILAQEIVDNFIGSNQFLENSLQQIIEHNGLVDQQDLIQYILGLQSNATALNTFVNAYVEPNLPPGATQAERLSALASHIVGINNFNSDIATFIDTLAGVNNVGDLIGFVNTLKDAVATLEGNQGYFTINDIIAAEGISLNDLINIKQQMALAGADIDFVSADLDNSKEIGSGDLLRFLAKFTQNQFDVNYDAPFSPTL